MAQEVLGINTSWYFLPTKTTLTGKQTIQNYRKPDSFRTALQFTKK